MLPYLVLSDKLTLHSTGGEHKFTLPSMGVNMDSLRVTMESPCQTSVTFRITNHVFPIIARRKLLRILGPLVLTTVVA